MVVGRLNPEKEGKEPANGFNVCFKTPTFTDAAVWIASLAQG
jgi:hypothetical protein